MIVLPKVSFDCILLDVLWLVPCHHLRQALGTASITLASAQTGAMRAAAHVQVIKGLG